MAAQPELGGLVLVASNRQNDVLAEQGYDLGIRPSAVFVPFTELVQIEAFGFGSIGGGPAICDPGGVGVEIGIGP